MSEERLCVKCGACRGIRCDCPSCGHPWWLEYSDREPKEEEAFSFGRFRPRVLLEDFPSGEVTPSRRYA